jgi:hypothetical protein
MRTSKAINLSIKFRGSVLHMVSYLELTLNMYIAKFFCGEDTKKIEEMFVLLLGDDRVSFKSIVDVFVQIAKKYDLDWYKSYKGLKKDLRLDLIYIVEERNVIAHRVVTGNEFLENPSKDELHFIKFKNSINTSIYTQTQIDELNSLIKNAIDFVNDRLKEISPALKKHMDSNYNPME